MRTKKLIPILLALTMFIGAASATVISVSEIEYESNADFFDGELVAIEMLADESTETIEATIEADTISSQITGETEQSIRINAEETNQYVEFGISDVSDKKSINRVKAVNELGFDDLDEAHDWATSNCEFGIYYHDYYLTWTGHNTEVYCMQETEKLASVGEFRNDATSPRQVFDVRYALDIDGQPTETVTLSNSALEDSEGTTSSLGNQVRIEWLGNYDLGVNPEGMDSGALPAQNNDFSQGWRVIDENAYNQYTSHVEYNIGDRLRDWGQEQRSKEDIEAEVNNLALEAASENTGHPLSQARITDSGINDAIMQFEPDANLFHPSFILYVNAGQHASDAITVTRPAGVPDIVSTTGGEIPELGSEGQVTMVAQNVGGHEGQFEARVSACTDDFSFDDTVRQRNIAAGDTSEFTFTIGFDSQSTTDEIDGSCEVELTEITEGSSVTDSIAVTGLAQDQCNSDTPYPTVVNGNEVIVECADGDEQLVETCDQDQVTSYQDGEWQCVDEEDPQKGGLFGTGFTPLQDISDAISGGLGTIQTITMLLGGIATLAASLFTFGVSYTRLFDTFMLGKVTEDFGVAQHLVRFVFAALFALMVGFIVYTLATSIWVQVAVLAGLIIGAYLYVQFGGIIKAFM